MSNTIKWVLLFISVVLLATWAQGQEYKTNWSNVKFRYDSIQIKVTYSHKINDTTINYIFKLPSGEKVKSVCYCKEQRKKGDIVTLAKKDIEFIKPVY